MSSQLSIEQELATVRASLDERDFSHAARHLASLAAVDPGNQQAAEYMDRLIGATRDPLALVPLREGAYYGEVALRAAMLARKGEMNEAVDLLLLAQSVAPDVPYEKWLDSWLAEDTARAKLDIGVLFPNLSRCLRHERVTQALAPLLYTLAMERRPDAKLAFLGAQALRKAGRVTDAVAIARRAHAAEPQYLTAVALGKALEKCDDMDGAVRALEEAVHFDPEEMGVRLDLGDAELGRRRWDCALAAYEAVLVKEADEPWALSSSLYIRAIRGDDSSRDRLRALADRGVARARALLWRLEPYLHVLPVPASALVNVAREVADSRKTIRGVTMTSIEPPSAVMALADTVRAINQETLPAIGFREIPDPDPRLPRGEVTYLLWTYDGTNGRPALPPPGLRVAMSIAEIARSEYDLDPWWSRAEDLGTQLGATAVESLLAVMVHPPERPEAFAPWDWRFRVQVAAAMSIAAVDGGWEGSARCAALMSALLGPVDWSSSAAVIALVELARRNEELRATVVTLLVAEILVPMSPIRFECIVQPGVPLMLARVPLSAETEQVLASVARRENL